MLLSANHWTRTSSTRHSRRQGKVSLLELCRTIGKPTPVSKLKPAYEIGFQGVNQHRKVAPLQHSELFTSFIGVLNNRSPRQSDRPGKTLDTSDQPLYEYRRHGPMRYFTASQRQRPRHRKSLTAEEIAIQRLKTRQQRCSLDMDQQIKDACAEFKVDPFSLPENTALLRDSSVRLRNAFKHV